MLVIVIEYEICKLPTLNWICYLLVLSLFTYYHIIHTDVYEGAMKPRVRQSCLCILQKKEREGWIDMQKLMCVMCSSLFTFLGTIQILDIHCIMMCKEFVKLT